MTRILRIYILESGVFDNVPKGLLCLSGVNGAGKTTILEFITTLFNSLSTSSNKIGIIYKTLRY